MSTEECAERFAAITGRIRLESWAASPTDGDRLDCRATITVGGHDHALSARATGQLGALSAMLYDLGAGVEIHRLHQRHDGADVITILLCGNDDRQWWAVGTGADGDEANRNALIAGANLVPH
ncbi:MAG TPA: hypothetical protein PK331_06505 [Gordonia sp. (in: high G+C Gram-positive bacteria)]|uniref:hypothetical protein n=1 Tax=unclassified Gordonia (in: high G+C Gram-positive bacteria) TaxID=2657482 RepID=UPI000FAA9D0C|nr:MULTISPECIES: hypothetical protein [unclassified Gordonia (in: high G+C Gram-positive bacteria)]RUP41468.1 MAG: hypothetical protein EKK60_00965 [Gordonia sp. (in: high G+C Gram-positive bacteria)]HNP57121.1 hypothetical protein [Gordonia sp. (in: high G+C Gram-positive bacteria)]HRC50559.1 hypothetical protein [Gordonia sp. (in: high G+C Gram-positive bacteria)]